MSRLNNIVLVYLIVEKYFEVEKNAVNHFLLEKFVIQKTGVKKDTANKYINTLLNGITIEGKFYQIIYVDGGYKCLKR